MIACQLKTLLNVNAVLLVSLILTSCNQVKPFVFDTQNSELIRDNNGEIERISYHDDKVKEFLAFDKKDIKIINKCLKRCGK